MKFIKSLALAAFLAIGLTASAQTTDKPEYVFNHHWFLNLEGGAQYTLGEAKFDDLISPNVQFGLGYQANPWFAVRLQANAWQSKGGWNGYTQGNSTPETVTYKWKYVAPGLDFMFNLSNAFCGFNPKRFFNVTAFIGGGANIAWGNDKANTLKSQGYDLRYIWDGTKVKAFGRGGAELAFRLSDAVKFVVEGNVNILNDRYNSKKAGNADWYFNALAGFRINLGKTYKKVEAPAPEPVVEPAPEPVVTPAPEPVKEVEKVEPLRRDVFFTINSTKITDEENQKVQEVVDYLNKYPEAKVVVTGYADAGTGNATINSRLASGRADIVVKALKEKYGISADRITMNSKGDTVQPFSENDKNRVSICIAQ
jgi:OOP family OmpA-OmpF porin